MPIVKYEIWITITILAAFMRMNMLLEEENGIQYQFTQTDSTYSFYSSFTIIADPKCLLEISYDYEHIKALAPDAKEVLLVDQGNDWNKISYTYQKFVLFENKSVWFRKLDEEKQRVDFILVASKNNNAIMPRMISSSGYYQVKRLGEYCTVEYYQQCHLTESIITKLYLNRAKNEAIRFMYRFREYAGDSCSDTTSIEN